MVKQESCVRCNREQEITEMHTILKRIDKDFYGDGNSGLKTRFERYEGAVKLLSFLLAFLGIGNLILTFKLFYG